MVDDTPKRLKILLVDDDSAVLRSLTRSLRIHFDVDPVSGFLAALERLDIGSYDAVVTDENMPDGRGRALLAIVRDRFPACRRVLMSGEHVPSEHELGSTFEHFFRKPPELARLIDLLKVGRS